MKRYLLSAFYLALTFVIATPVYADWRSYVWTYEYMTLPKGIAEVEYYLTAQAPDTAESRVNTWKHWVELEYGITNRWKVNSLLIPSFILSTYNVCTKHSH